MSGKTTPILGKHSREESSVTTPPPCQTEFNARTTFEDDSVQSLQVVANTPCSRCVHRAGGAPVECIIAIYDEMTGKAVCKQCQENKNNYCNVQYNPRPLYDLSCSPFAADGSIMEEEPTAAALIDAPVLITSSPTTPTTPVRTTRASTTENRLRKQLLNAKIQITEGQRMVKAGHQLAVEGQGKIHSGQDHVMQAYYDHKEGQGKFKEGLDLTEKGFKVLEQGYEAQALARSALDAFEAWKDRTR